MAVFKAPRLTEVQRMGLVLDASEVVFDTTVKSFFGGDGITLGGFPIGKGIGTNVDNVTLTQENLDDKKVLLTSSPAVPGAVTLLPIGGIPQVNGIDFEVVGNELSWDGLGLDNFLELGEQLIIQY
jgi:hypothetical protein